MVEKDKTYQMLYDFILCDIKENEVEQYKVVLDKWIAARDSIIDVFIETLEVRQKTFHCSNEERTLIHAFRCLNSKTRAKYAQEIQHTYSMECKRRSENAKR